VVLFVASKGHAFSQPLRVQRHLAVEKVFEHVDERLNHRLFVIFLQAVFCGDPPSLEHLVYCEELGLVAQLVAEHARRLDGAFLVFGVVIGVGFAPQRVHVPAGGELALEASLHQQRGEVHTYDGVVGLVVVEVGQHFEIFEGLHLSCLIEYLLI